VGQVFRETFSIIPTKTASAVTIESAVSLTRQESIIDSSGAIFITTLEIDPLVEAEEYPVTGRHHRRV
jgi:hypothetical protein